MTGMTESGEKTEPQTDSRYILQLESDGIHRTTIQLLVLRFG